MSDSTTTKRTRSVINPIKEVNELRVKLGLPKMSAKPKAIKITSELKKLITKQEVEKLFPLALSDATFELNEKQAKELVKEVEQRINRIKSGKEALPEGYAAAPSAPKAPKAAKAPKAPKAAAKKPAGTIAKKIGGAPKSSPAKPRKPGPKE